MLNENVKKLLITPEKVIVTTPGADNKKVLAS